MLGLGAVLLVLGTAVLRGTRTLTVAALMLVGLGMVVVPLAFSLPSKANDAHKLADLGKVALSRTAADAAASATKVIDAAVTETDRRMIPALAARLGVSTAEMNRIVANRFPAVAQGIARWPAIRPGAYHLAAIQSQSVADNQSMGGVPFRALPWLLIVPGVVLFAVSGIAYLETRRARER